MGCVKSKGSQQARSQQKVVTGGTVDPLAAAGAGKSSVTEPVNVGTSVISDPNAGKKDMPAGPAPK